MSKSIGAGVDVQNQEGESGCALKKQLAWSRRALFGAAGGFALAASGLLLPEWLDEEAEAADNHPVRGVQQRKAQRRRKQRGGRDNHQGHHRRRDDARKPPQFGPKGIRLKVVNETGDSFAVCQHWVGTVGWYRIRFENLGKKGSTTSTFTNDTEELHAGILFPGNKEPFVWVENPFAGTPNTTYQSGGTFSPFGYSGGTTIVNHGTLEEGAETTHRIDFTSTRTYAIKVRRETDVIGFKSFTMTVLPN